MIADRLINLSAIIATIALFVLMGVILVDVIGRGLGMPLYGSQDLIGMTMVIVVFGGMALCDRDGGHVSVDLLETRFPVSINHSADVFSAFLGAIVFSAIAWAVFKSSKISLMLNIATNLLDLPKAWFQWILCALAAFCAFAMALRGIELAFNICDVRRERTPPV